MFSISKNFPVIQDLKIDAVKFALEKLCFPDADVAEIQRCNQRADLEVMSAYFSPDASPLCMLICNKVKL